MKRTLLTVLAVLILAHAPWRLAELLCVVPFVSVTDLRTSDHNDRYWDVQDLEARLRALGWTVQYTSLGPAIYGQTDTFSRNVWISQTLGWNARLATLAHEAGHTRQPEWVTHTQGEAYAEMVAALIAPDGIREHARYLARMRGDTFLMAVTEWRSIYRTADLYTND